MYLIYIVIYVHLTHYSEVAICLSHHVYVTCHLLHSRTISALSITHNTNPISLHIRFLIVLRDAVSSALNQVSWIYDILSWFLVILGFVMLRRIFVAVIGVMVVLMTYTTEHAYSPFTFLFGCCVFNVVANALLTNIFLWTALFIRSRPGGAVYEKLVWLVCRFDCCNGYVCVAT
jgi:hypothetical protein